MVKHSFYSCSQPASAHCGRPWPCHKGLVEQAPARQNPAPAAPHTTALRPGGMRGLQSAQPSPAVSHSQPTLPRTYEAHPAESSSRYGLAVRSSCAVCRRRSRIVGVPSQTQSSSARGRRSVWGSSIHVEDRALRLALPRQPPVALIPGGAFNALDSGASVEGDRLLLQGPVQLIYFLLLVLQISQENLWISLWPFPPGTLSVQRMKCSEFRGTGCMLLPCMKELD